jgi:Zn-dependent protease
VLGWSLNLFRVRGIQLAVHFSFFLLLAFVGWEGMQPYPDPENPAALIGGGWVGMLVNVGTILVLFTCVVLHEFGHSFTAMAFGVNVRRILLMPIGGMAEFDNIPREPARELLITLAGPAVNFAIAALLSLAIDVPAGWKLISFPYYPATAEGFAQLVLHWNLLMGCFNLVPAFPMDGGRILRALLATHLPYVRATFVAATVGKVLASLAALFALFVWEAPLTAVLFTFIVIAGELEYRAVRRRELEEAHWRAMLAQLYHLDPPRSDPPLLVR